jgi:hypothetical protein
MRSPWPLGLISVYVFERPHQLPRLRLQGAVLGDHVVQVKGEIRIPRQKDEAQAFRRAVDERGAPALIESRSIERFRNRDRHPAGRERPAVRLVDRPLVPLSKLGDRLINVATAGRDRGRRGHLSAPAQAASRV